MASVYVIILHRLVGQSAHSVQDLFLLVGPSEAINPAALDEQNDDTLKMFSKIVDTGNAHATVSFRFTSILQYTKQAFVARCHLQAGLLPDFCHATIRALQILKKANFSSLSDKYYSLHLYTKDPTYNPIRFLGLWRTPNGTTSILAFRFKLSMLQPS